MKVGYLGYDNVLATNSIWIKEKHQGVGAGETDQRSRVLSASVGAISLLKVAR